MRHPWAWAAALAATLVSPTAFAQNFGQLSPAPPIATGTHLMGAYISGDDNALGLLAQLRLSFYPNIDFGFQGGLNRIDAEGRDRTTVRMGGDVKFGLVHAGEASPVDVSMGAAIGVQTGDRYTVLSLGPSVQASRSFNLTGGSSVAPYLGMLLRFSSVDVAGASDTDFDLGLRLGGELRVSPDLGFLAELHFNDDSGADMGFLAGFNTAF
jgi:hypothetical protein